MNAEGQMSSAEKAQREMVDRRLKELGPNHLSTLKGQLKLASTLKRNPNEEVLHEAKNMLQNLIQQFSENPDVGEMNELTLTAMNNLAQVFAKLNRDEESEAMFRRTLAGREEVLGKHHPDTMITVNNLALLVDARKGNGNVPGSEADQLYRRALPFTPRGEIP
eukprot:CAMPEP_0172585310 /NCGR_PEP_ID=MMETSP1068-20121228/4726_1 /TAXON_ID=35684 /ORGANISM="Pseudopedinella elastica, Strain CCMP716" /LENGTH=163 /DNA_ID=CAMNT_0013379711 /DNA_START=77 /DNA_END=568 /DNA_ORIENTATION=+